MSTITPMRHDPPASPGREGAPSAERERRRRVSPGVRVVGVILVTLTATTATCFAVGGILQGMAWLSQQASATQTHTFTVAGVPNVVLTASAGNVHIVPGVDGQVTATLTSEVNAVTHQAAQDLLKRITLDASQSGATVNISVDTPAFEWFPWYVQRRVTLTLAIPTASNLDLTLSAGNLDVRGISGTFVGRVSAGNLDLRDMAIAGDSSLHISAGNVTLRSALASGASLDVAVTAGNVAIVLPTTTATHVEARATAGNVSLVGWRGFTGRNAAQEYISADLNPPTTSTLSIHVTAGNVSVRPA